MYDKPALWLREPRPEGDGHATHLCDTDSNGETEMGPDRESPPSTPRWVKVFGIATLVTVLLVVVMMATRVGGRHGPGRHMRSGCSGGHASHVGGAQRP